MSFSIYANAGFIYLAYTFAEILVYVVLKSFGHKSGLGVWSYTWCTLKGVNSYYAVQELSRYFNAWHCYNSVRLEYLLHIRQRLYLNCIFRLSLP